MDILHKIIELGFNEDRLKLDEATFNTQKDELTISFIYPETEPLSTEDKEKINSLIHSSFEGICAVAVKYNKSCFDTEVIYERIEEYLDKFYRVLKSEVKREDITINSLDSSQGIEIVFDCDELRKQVLMNKQFDTDLANYLMRKFFVNFTVKLVATRAMADLADLRESMPEVDTSLSDALAKESEINKMDVEIGECFYGRYTSGKVDFIADLPGDDKAEVLVAGVITNFTLNTFQSKTKLDGNPIERKKLSFTLTDPSGSIEVVIFPQDKFLHSLEILEDGMSVAVGGNLSIFKERKNLRANSLSKCEIFTKELTRVYRKVNDKYHFVQPQPVTETQQMDLFNLNAKTTDYWDTHDSVVVFDLETTGFDSRNCKIIEIGAVKIVKGSIVETFQTLINPMIEIPAEITNLTHIDDSMVADAPTIDQVLPDFYKFTFGSVLSAYNIDFDYQFLDFNGKKNRLLFDNEQIDTLRLVRDKVPSLSNYKLGTVVKALNITLNNAHRALADAYATAKVFVKLI